MVHVAVLLIIRRSWVRAPPAPPASAHPPRADDDDRRRAGRQRIRKDTKTHQDRWLAIDPVTCALIESYLAEIRAELAAVGAGLRDDAYLFSNDPAHARPWNPDWVSHRVTEVVAAAGVELDIKGGRHYYTASQLLAGGFDLRNTAARLGHSGGGATTLRHYADPVPEVDRRGARPGRGVR